MPDDEAAVLALRSASISLTSDSSSCLTLTTDALTAVNNGAVTTKRSADDLFVSELMSSTIVVAATPKYKFTRNTFYLQHDSYLFSFNNFTADNTALCSGQTDGVVYSLTISYDYIVTNPMDASYNNTQFRYVGII